MKVSKVIHEEQHADMVVREFARWTIYKMKQLSRPRWCLHQLASYKNVALPNHRELFLWTDRSEVLGRKCSQRTWEGAWFDTRVEAIAVRRWLEKKYR